MSQTGSPSPHERSQKALEGLIDLSNTPPFDSASQTRSSSPRHRHQSSLEGIIDFSTEPPLDPAARDQARRKFYRIVEYFDDSQGGTVRTVGGGAGVGGDTGSQYNRAQLIRLTYDYACSPISQDNFLRAFFRSVELSMDDSEDVAGELELNDDVRSTFFRFSDYLFDNFFLPIKASTRKTPQPTPKFHSAITKLQGGGEFAGTPDRLSALRGACLIRDRHRCVVSRSFDREEAHRRLGRGGSARDDDGAPLENETLPLHHLEVAHILPHSLTRLGKGRELDASKQAALAILNMFDNGVGHLIEGANIDKTQNALTLTLDIHRWFGNFDIYFEPVTDAAPHTYKIEGFGHPLLFNNVVPVTRTLYLTDDRTIDPPSPRLLAIHRAIGHILHLSAAGEYIDKILRDLEKAQWEGAEVDGSTDLGRLVHLGLWLDGAINAY